MGSKLSVIGDIKIEDLKELCTRKFGNDHQEYLSIQFPGLLHRNVYDALITLQNKYPTKNIYISDNLPRNFDENRICLFYDKFTLKITQIPENG